MISKFDDYVCGVALPLTDSDLKKIVREDCYRIVCEVNDGSSDVRTMKSDFELYHSKNMNISVWASKFQPMDLFSFVHNKFFVYRYSDIGTCKVYHGITDRQIRAYEHIENSGGKKSDKLMCLDFCKFGTVFEVLFVCDTKDEARKVEKMYNNKLITEDNLYCYNLIV